MEKKFDPAASAARKAMPVFDGTFMYFPDALLAIAAFSHKANEKHNPGEPLHWSQHKSSDHANCIGRHLLDIGPDWTGMDPEFDIEHAVPLAWRALALLQIVLKAKQLGMKPKEYIAKLKRDAESPKPQPAPAPINVNQKVLADGDYIWLVSDTDAPELRVIHVGENGTIFIRDGAGAAKNFYRTFEALADDVGPGRLYSREKP